jgi:hypothetical protein
MMVMMVMMMMMIYTLWYKLSLRLIEPSHLDLSSCISVSTGVRGLPPLRHRPAAQVRP